MASELEIGMLSALSEARKAFEKDEVPVGAALYFSGQLIASGHNLCHQHNDPTEHAELLVLKSGLKKLGNLKNCTLYVTLEPCAMCAGACVQAGLGNLVFGAFDDKEGCCGSLIDLTDHWLSGSVRTRGGVLEAECTALLSHFFQNKR